MQFKWDTWFLTSSFLPKIGEHSLRANTLNTLYYPLQGKKNFLNWLTILTRENCVLLISVQEFIEIEYRCLNKVIHQITVLGIFQIASRLGDRYVFMWQPLKMLSIFNILTWKKTKNEKLFQKTGVLLFRWNYWDRKCKISMQNCSVRSHVKTNRMGSTKWTYQTLQVTTSFFFFFENSVSV